MRGRRCAGAPESLKRHREGVRRRPPPGRTAGASGRAAGGAHVMPGGGRGACPGVSMSRCVGLGLAGALRRVPGPSCGGDGGRRGRASVVVRRRPVGVRTKGKWVRRSGKRAPWNRRALPGKGGPRRKTPFPQGGSQISFPWGARPDIRAGCQLAEDLPCGAVGRMEMESSRTWMARVGEAPPPEDIAGARGRSPTGDGPAFRCRSPTAREGSGPRPRATCLWTRAGPGRGRVLECRIVPSPQEPSPWT